MATDPTWSLQLIRRLKGVLKRKSCPISFLSLVETILFITFTCLYIAERLKCAKTIKCLVLSRSLILIQRAGAYVKQLTRPMYLHASIQFSSSFSLLVFILYFLFSFHRHIVGQVFRICFGQSKIRLPLSSQIRKEVTYIFNMQPINQS